MSSVVVREMKRAHFTCLRARGLWLCEGRDVTMNVEWFGKRRGVLHV